MTTDELVLQQLLSSTFSYDQVLRSDAEKQLENISLSPYFLQRLLSFAIQDSIEISIRQAASIYLKNMIESRWRLDENQRDEAHHPILESDKAQVRDNLVSAMISCSKFDAVLKPLNESVRKIVRHDFPSSWPNLLQQLHASILSNSKEGVKVALLVLGEVLHWKGYDSDSETEEIQSIFVPIMLQIATNAIKQNSDDGFYLVRLVLKGFKSCISLQFSRPIMSCFDGWNALLCQVIAMPVPDAYSSSLFDAIDSEINEELENSNFWKMKKWAFNALSRLFDRYLTQKTTLDSSSKAFKGEFQAKYAGPVVEICLKLIESIISKSSILTENCYMHLCDMLESAIKNNFIWKTYLKTNMIHIIQLFLFPRICFTEENAEEWQEDPAEYVRAHTDSYEEYESSAMVSLNMISTCVKNRRKSVFMELLSFLNAILSSSTAAANEKEGALRLLGTLSNLISKTDQISSQIGVLIHNLILPILVSETLPGFLKTRAAWTIEQFSIDSQLESEVSIACFSALSNCLSAKNELPLRVASALALGGLIDGEAIQSSLANDSGILVLTEAILDLTNQVEIEALSSLIEKIVSMYSDELSPYAAQLALQLVNTFSRIMASVEEQQDPKSDTFEFEGTDRMMSAVGIMRALNTLIDSMSSNQQIVATLEPVIIPLVITVFERRVSDVYDETFDIICALTFIIKSTSPAMWRIFRMMFVLYERTELEYISEICSVLDNIICNDANQTVQNQEYLNLLLGMIFKIISQEEDTGMGEQEDICRILESLYLNTKLMPTDVTTQLLALLSNRIEIEVKECNKLMIVKITEVVLAILYSNPSFYPLIAPRIWENVIEVSKLYTRVFDKKLVILSLSQVLASLDNPHLLCVYLEAINSLPEAIAKRQKLIEEGKDEDNFDYDEAAFMSDSDYDSLSECESPESQNPQELDLNKEEESSDYWSDDYGSNDDFEVLEENVDVQTVLDDIDVSGVVKNSIRMVNPHLISSISQEQQQFLKTLI